MTERRSAPRSGSSFVRRIAARIRPGQRVAVVDLSASGARVHAARPLRPGARVDMLLTTAASESRLSALVVRCQVTALDPDLGVIYEAAMAFATTCSLVCESVSPFGYEVPELGSAATGRYGSQLPAAFESAAGSGERGLK